MKKTRRRIDVNLVELDQVLDSALEAPLSEADHDRLKDALHALAALLVRSRNTEKTSEVLEKPEDSQTGTPPDNNTTPPPGHGRNGAEAFGGAHKVDIKHHKLTHGDRCPECGIADQLEQTGGGERCRYVLEMLGQGYRHDAEARECGLTPEERLQLHQERSRPVMDKLHAWLESQLAERKTEPNSGLGQAIENAAAGLGIRRRASARKISLPGR